MQNKKMGRTLLDPSRSSYVLDYDVDLDLQFYFPAKDANVDRIRTCRRSRMCVHSKHPMLLSGDVRGGKKCSRSHLSVWKQPQRLSRVLAWRCRPSKACVDRVSASRCPQPVGHGLHFLPPLLPLRDKLDLNYEDGQRVATEPAPMRRVAVGATSCTCDRCRFSSKLPSLGANCENNAGIVHLAL